jgi:predicted molibdopterin-dependent oxidoreductase YjgC
MRIRLLVVAISAFVLAACGGGSGPSLGVAGPPSAKAVAANDSDFSGMTSCPESGSWDTYLKAEQTKDPSQYQTDKTNWDDSKAAGANDSYIAVYSASAADCGGFGATTPTGKVAYVFTVRYKDTNSASASYKAGSKQIHLSDTDLANIKAAGGTVQQGSATGLGDNSIVVALDVTGASIYIAYWQKKQFEVAVVSYQLPSADAEVAAKKIDARIT